MSHKEQVDRIINRVKEYLEPVELVTIVTLGSQLNLPNPTSRFNFQDWQKRYPGMTHVDQPDAPLLQIPTANGSIKYIAGASPPLLFTFELMMDRDAALIEQWRNSRDANQTVDYCGLRMVCLLWTYEYRSVTFRMQEVWQ